MSRRDCLQARAGLEAQRLAGAGRLSGSGLRWLPVSHRGNTNQSDEEVDAIRALVDELLAASGGHGTSDEIEGKGTGNADAAVPRFVHAGGERPLRPRDLLVVAPYNAQVAALRRAARWTSFRAKKLRSSSTR